jgi:glycerophosphoryl diester phosphodiesterase
MDVIGHRGAAAVGPENTVAGLRAALGAGADGVEIDVRLSSDGVAVLMHDPDVARTTNGSGLVRELTADSLAALGVATFAEALEIVPRDRILIVELKGTPWDPGHDPAEPVARTVAEMLDHEAQRRVIVSSFNPLALAVVRQLAPTVATGVLTPTAFDLGSNIAAAVDGGHSECHVPAEILEEGFVERAHAAGKRVVAWTVNDAAAVTRLASWNVDGVITDDPRVALAALGR